MAIFVFCFSCLRVAEKFMKVIKLSFEREHENNEKRPVPSVFQTTVRINHAEFCFPTFKNYDAKLQSRDVPPLAGTSS